MAGTLILFKWSLDEIYTHLTTLSALAAETVSEQTNQGFEKFVISEDEKLFVSSNIESPLLRVAAFFRRITPDEVQPVVNDKEVGFSFVPRIAGGKFSYTDESLLRAKSLDMICAQILVRWYALRSIAPLASWLSQEYSRSAVELETTLQQFIRPAYVGRATNIVEVSGDIDPKAQDNTTNVTHEQLLSLVESSALIPNREYRITDYSTSVADDAILVAVGHRYDIIVHADTPNTLSERARAAHSSEDAYFNEVHLSAWDIRYSVLNDTARFPWCSPDGKGVVYYLCDEHGNRAGYDFKNICFDTELGRLYSISVMDNETGEQLDGSLFSATQCSFLGQAPKPNAILLNQGENADRVMLNNCADIYIYGTAKDITVTSCNNIIINLPYSENIQIGPYVAYLELYTTDNCTAEHPARNIYVHSGVKGTADNYENVNISVLPTDYRLEVANNALGKVRVYVLGSGGSIIEPGSVDTEAFAPTAIAPEARRISKGLTITTKNGSTRFDGEFETNITIPSGEYDKEIETLRQQVDRKADTYYQPTDPSLDWPAQDYAIHEGDLWQDTTINKTFRWNGTEWEPFEVPLEVFDAIDGKSSIYTVRPNSYKKNDLWILEAEYLLADGVMYSAGTIVIALVSSDVFDRSHWTKRDRYTDDVATNNAINNLKALVKDLQNQIDGNVTSYEGTAIPTLDNYPANEWETIEEKERQIGSYYDQRVTLPDGTTTYKRFRFSKIADGVYDWTELADSDVSEAIAAAREALGLAGTKARLFYGDGVPVPPYNINDMWVMTTGVIYICNADRAEGDMAEDTDWQVANDAALRLRNIAADNMVTMEEKSALRNLLSQVRKEYAKYVEDAEKYGVDIASLQEAYRALINIFTTVFEVEYNTDTIISDNDRDLYNNAYANFYAEITRFTDAIADKKIQDAIADVSTDIVVRVDVEYRLSDSATEVTGDYPDWSTKAPEWIQGTYMWQRTVTVYRSGDTITVGPTCIAGAKGDTGVGIKSITEEYYLSSSPTELKGGEWEPTPPVWVYGKYYWTRSVILYTDGSSETTTPICVSAGAVYTLDLTNQMAGVIATAEGEITTELPTSTAIVYYGSEIDEGWSFSGAPEGCEATINKDSGEIVITAITADVAKVIITATKSMAPTLTTTFNVLVVRDGATGRSVASVINKYLASDESSGITTSTEGWTEEVQAVSANKPYLWNYEIVVYSDGAEVPTQPTIIGAYGKDGLDGRGIESIVEYYLVSDKSTGITINTSGWTETMQIATPDKPYLWNYEAITYTEGEPTTTEPIIIGVHGEEGTPATIYTLLPSVDKITKTVSGEIIPSEVSCTVYEITGKESRVEATAKILKYLREGQDKAMVVYDGPITITDATTSLYLYLYDTDNTKLLDAERIPVLADAKDLEDFEERLDNAEAAIVGIADDYAELSGTVDALGVDIGKIKEQTDKEFTIWFVEELPEVENEETYVPAPNTTQATPNYPASNWTTAADIEAHDQDIFYNKYLGRAWKFDAGLWEEITDASTIAALEKAMEAYRIAQEALSAANESNVGVAQNRDEIAQSLGYENYEQMVIEAAQKRTIIKDGFINTGLLQAERLITGGLAVYQKTDSSLITEAIFIEPDKTFQVVEYDTASDDGNIRMQIDKSGLQLFKTAADGVITTARYTGDEVADLRELIPTTNARIEIREMAIKESMLPTTSNTELTYELCNYTNTENVDLVVSLKTLSMIFRCYAVMSQDVPSGEFYISTMVLINGVVQQSADLSIAIPDRGAWEEYIDPSDQSGTIQYSGDYTYRGKIELNDIPITLTPNSTLRIITTFKCIETLSDCSIMYATRIGSTSDITGSPKTDYLSVSTAINDRQLLMSNYYGNGFVIAKNTSNYIAMLVDDNIGTQLEFRNGEIGFQIVDGVLKARSEEAWVEIDWQKMLELLKK